MTGPASGATEQGTRAPSRLTGTQGAVGAVLVVLALGLALRSIIAYLLPGSGFGVDLGAFRFWAHDLATNGPSGFYEREFFHDYTPGYLYVLWLVGIVGSVTGGVGDLIKIPSIVADLAIGWLVWSMILELGGRRSLALGAAFVAVMNPIGWFDSVVWGQVDSVGVVFLLLALRELWRDRPERAAILTIIAALIKPQLGILIPILALVTIRRAFWPVRDPASAFQIETDAPAHAGIRARLFAWERRTDHPSRIVTTAAVALITTVLLCLPFGLSVLEFSLEAPYLKSGLIAQIFATAAGYPYLSVNTFNPWALVAGDTGNSLANSGLWVCDGPWGPDGCGSGIAVLGGIPTVLVGSLLMLIVTLVTSFVAARRPDRLTILLSLTLLALAFYIVPTRVHERYAYPVFALAIILATIAWRWRLVYLALTVTVFLNMYAVLTNPFYENPGISDWLGIGPLIRSESSIAVIALINGAVFLWACAQLRAGARNGLAEDLAGEAACARAEDEPPEPVPAVTPGPPPSFPAVRETSVRPAVASPLVSAPAFASAVPLPTWTPRPTYAELGVLGWFKARLNEAPIRPDRSVTLRSERGGRLDRLDLWLLVVLVVAAMFLRTFRLAEPYQMHFDEVYHARTATEFLQSWRYGLSHDIYEWTHPHLAKYAMAGGLVLWGQDQARVTSDLGVPVKASVVEPRRDDRLSPGGRSGERLHVATGSEVRTYDLRTRALVSVVPAAGASALAIDPTGNQLIVGNEAGRISTIDLSSLGSAGVDSDGEAFLLATVDHPIAHLLVTNDGASIVASSANRLSVVDLAAGALRGSLDLPGIADLALGGSGSALVARVDEVTDPAALASTLADLLSGDPSDYEARLAEGSAGSTVVLGSPGTGDPRKALDTAIADGRLPGVSIDDVARVAVATSEGVTFIDPARVSKVSTTPLSGGAHGLALVTGLDDPKLYVTTGAASDPGYQVIAVGGDGAKAGPADLGRHPLPAPGTRVVYDPASQQVHILGLGPGSSSASGSSSSSASSTRAPSWTVYVVEPHGNAVYADARLPDGFVPTAWAADIEPDYPAVDRQQLLVFAGSGASASIDVGSHAFAWRLPGVIAGALTAGLLYLLARILFRRRLVAGLLALFVLADGMFFVQSRIGMNDVYVGLFIVAAYTLFAALWTGWLRGRAAFWLAMPVIGVLLGLALASKWVAAYAIGALVLLILVRSALGRVLSIIGLIGITGVLGYMAISVPEASGLGNLTFLLIMVALTLLAVVVAVVHPIAWTDEEFRFAVGTPVALGTLVFFGALAAGRLDALIVLGSVAVTPLLVAIALASGSLVVAGLFWLGGRVGFGPLATPPGPDDPMRLLEAAGEPPEGWLRPGWQLGLPVIYAALSLFAIPIAVYVASYVPWAMIENHQLVPGWPVGHTGQTLTDLTGQMYRYHNGLTAAHPAASPWWAWPMNLKPVWFYQESLGNGTAAALYDAGNMVIWWLGIPAIAFVSWMAFKRRSLALTLIAVGFAAQWIPWARIDRAAFQYHYYTALPFVVLSLAYFAAELWHGASRHTWQLARLAGAAAIVVPAIMWLLDRPLCAFVGVESVNPGSQACPAVIPQFVLTARSAGLAVVLGVGLVVIVLRFLAFDSRDRHAPGRNQLTDAFRSLIGVGFVVVAALVVVAFLPDTPILTLANVSVEPIALFGAIPLGYLALQVIGSRDARRFTIGLVVAAVSWFAVIYPNISALPLPSAVVNAYQGILPTHLYAFQFPISTVDRNVATPLLTPMLGVLLLALIATCLVVAYSASVWRLTLAGSAAEARASATSDDPEGLARTGGA